MRVHTQSRARYTRDVELHEGLMEGPHKAMRMNESPSTKPTTAPPRTRARRATRETPISRPGDDQIRQRAYEIYLRRDGRPGDPAEDWFCAERELVDETPAPTAAPSRPQSRRPRTTATRKRS